MREIIFTPRFEAHFGRAIREKRIARGDLAEEIAFLLEHLVADRPPPKQFRLHRLSGRLAGFHEVHLRRNLLLVFRLTPRRVVLHGLGSHEDLFKGTHPHPEKENTPWWKPHGG